MFATLEEATKVSRNRAQTNDRYRNFKQLLFTAGDEEQFFSLVSRETPTKDIQIETSCVDVHSKFAGVGESGVEDTFRYIFHKFKKGIFVKIQSNQLVNFIPFSNFNFRNEWSSKVSTDLPNLKHVNRDMKRWYANNYLMRYEYPVHEGDTNVTTFKHFLETLCKERDLPDIEFFLNKRDFPLLRIEPYEPYTHLWGDKHPLVSHNYPHYTPILSMVKHDNYADIPIPTADDWARCNIDRGYFIGCRGVEVTSVKSWNDKIDRAVFRGSSTGAGCDINTNMRLKLADMTMDYPQILDAGITKWNTRPRKLKDSSRLQVQNIHKFRFGLVSPLTPEQQSSYKYVINVDGHVSAYRLSSELSYGSVILKVDSEWELWFFKHLQPWVHYIPIESDLSDLVEKIQWCIENDSVCCKIAQNAVEFYNEYLCRDTVLDYMRDVLSSITREQKGYVYKIRVSDIAKVYEEKANYYSVKNCGYWQQVSDTFDPSLINRCTSVFENKNTVISCCSYESMFLMSKKSSRVDELVHEKFASIFCINRLVFIVPNFLYTLPTLFENTIYREYVPAQTLMEFIGSEQYTFYRYINILKQLSLSLEVSKWCNLEHNDLTPWNILVELKSAPVTLNYSIGNSFEQVVTDVVVKIIDFGKCYVEYNGCSFGVRQTVGDVRIMLLTSLHQILYKGKAQVYVRELCKLVEFLEDVSPFNNLSELARFVTREHKYSRLMSSTNKPNPLEFYGILQQIQFEIPPSKPVLLRCEWFQSKDDWLDVLPFLVRAGFSECITNNILDEVEHKLGSLAIIQKTRKFHRPSPRSLTSKFEIRALQNTLEKVGISRRTRANLEEIKKKIDLCNKC